MWNKCCRSYFGKVGFNFLSRLKNQTSYSCFGSSSKSNVASVEHSSDQQNTNINCRYVGQPSAATHPFIIKSNEVTPGLTKTEFSERRQKLLELLISQLSEKDSSTDLQSSKYLLLLPAASVTFYAPDVPHPFRQNSDFLYFSGFREPDSFLAITKSADSSFHQSTLFVAHRDPVKEQWDGPRAGLDGSLQLTGVDQTLEHKDFGRFVHEFTKSGTTYLCFDHKKIIGEKQKVIMEALNSGPGCCRVGDVDLLTLMHQIRWIKSQSEIELMRKTCRIGSSALAATMRFTRPNVNENHLVAFMDLESRLRGAHGLAYPPVTAGGSRATIIHYLNADQVLHENDMVLMDSGCDYYGYVSDITRTWPVSGVFNDAQRQLYEALYEVQEGLVEIVKTVRPLILNELYVAQQELIGSHLQGLGILSSKLADGQLRQIFCFPAVEKFCPHHVSHYLGMDVHDTHKVVRNIPVQPGVVITVEPGIYIPTDANEVLEKFRGVGIRIEDDVLITETSAENLTETCPKTIDDIEMLFR